MNSNKKESIAITALINEVNKFDNIQDELKKRDKEPVWDGNLYLYKKDTSKKSDIVGRIPVQIKGTDAKLNNGDNILYNVELVDIENYKKDNKGAIFFVIEITPDRSTKIYYKIFDLKTVDKILEENKQNKKTKRFKFKELQKNDLISLCIEFIKKLNIYENIKPIKEIEVYDKQVKCFDYNTKYELEEIKESNKVFYETNAYKNAKEKLQKQNIIILHGEPWVGKTSTARKLAMNYIEQGYIFIYGNVDDLVEIKKNVSVNEKIICLIDDFLGSNIQYLEKNIAESTLDRIVSMFKNANDKKLILTTRTYIYNNAKKLFYKFHHATSIKDEYLVDVVNYNYMEKGNILYNHMEKNNLLGTDKHFQIVTDDFYTKIISHDNFNPGVISLICEKINKKDVLDVKEYIETMLNSPDKLWEEEYQKLSIHEKIILTIIVLFGIKVPEKYIEEQFNEFVKNENIQVIDTETFKKSVYVLSDAFVKITFNEKQEKELEVCKHSIADYIINKIKRKDIDIYKYIKSAKYVEVLSYIQSILYDNEEVKEKLAYKVESELNIVKEFFYDKTIILYGILKRKLNENREKILKDMIRSQFYNNKANLIINILEQENDPLYLYTIEEFDKYVIQSEEVDFLYRIIYISDGETFFNTCLKILQYKKNSNYMIENFYEIADILSEIVTEEVGDTIKDGTIEYVAEDIIAGKKLNDIIKEYILAAIDDEIPSLRDLYSKQNYNKMLKFISDFSNIYVDEEQLKITIRDVKQQQLQENKKTEDDEIIIFDHYNKVNEEQVKSIKEKFEKGIIKTNSRKMEEKNYYNIIDIETRMNASNKWWINSFINENEYNEYMNLKLYVEFINKKKNIDYSIKGLAKQFLKYLLCERNQVSKQAIELLAKIAYESFLKGNFDIDEKDIKKYQKQNPKEMKELYNAEIMIKKSEGYTLVNKYVHLYIVINELIKRKDSLLTVICIFQNSDTEEVVDFIIENKQAIFQLYSELNISEFNKTYLIPALKIIVNGVKNKYKKIGKINASKAIIDTIQLTINLDLEFRTVGIEIKNWLIMDFIKFVADIDIQWDLNIFDYGIYQEVFYQKCFNDEHLYVLNFNKILKDKELKIICDRLKIWDFMYDIFLECEKALEALHEDSNLNVYHIAKKDIEKKYFA